MSLDITTFLSLANLACINVLVEETSIFAKEIASILYWIQQLQTVNTESTEPMTTIIDIDLYLRDDTVNEVIDADYILANSPESIEDFFLVPKLVE